MPVLLDMELPTGCIRCKYRAYYDGSRWHDDEWICELTRLPVNGYGKERDEACPMKEVKE